MSVLRSLGAEIGAAGAFAGPPSVAHAEALLRGIELRSATLAALLDAVCIGIPSTTPYVPRERPNPVLASYLGLGLALRLWRDAFPVVEGGTAILLHHFNRAYARPTQEPYRTFFNALAEGREPEELAPREREAAADERAIDSYRGGRGCHPLLPFADWAACRPALGRLGRGARRRLPRRRSGGSSGSSRRTGSGPRWRWPTAGRIGRRGSGSCSPRPTFPLRVSV